MAQDNIKATIVDVRTPREYEESHYPSAINIPLDQLDQHIDDMRNMETPVIVYCASGVRSGLAVSILKHAGIPGVENGGGLKDMFNKKNKK